MRREISLDANFAECEFSGMDLDQYMQQNDIPLFKLAALLDRPVSTVHGWKSGRRLPSASDLARIEVVTGGAVTVHDFVKAIRAA